MKLKDVQHLFVFDEYCEVYVMDSDQEEPEFSGFCSDVPFWLANMELDTDGAIGTGHNDDEKECIVFCVKEIC